MTESTPAYASWSISALPWRIGDQVIATSSHARGPRFDQMLRVEAGEVGIVIELHEGWAPDIDSPNGADAWAVVEWPSGLRDAWGPLQDD